MGNNWRKDLKKAPKNLHGEVDGPIVLGWDGRKQATMFYTTAYPLNEGGWVTGFMPTDYIDTPQRFYPTHWKQLDEPPKD